MKHLKTINELYKTTYLSAADILGKRGETERADKLRKHAEEWGTDKPIIKIGNFVITQNDLDTKYRSKIVQHYGEYTEDTIQNALWTLYDIQRLHKNGGYIYRVIWLKNEEDFDINKLGHHWVANKSDAENIAELFTWRDEPEGKPYYIKAYTPPMNVTVANDYFNNLDENEVLVVDDKKLTEVTIQSQPF